MGILRFSDDVARILVSEITCTRDTFLYRSLFVSPYTSALQIAEDVSAQRIQLNITEQVRRFVDRNSLHLQVLVIISRYSKMRIKITLNFPTLHNSSYFN